MTSSYFNFKSALGAYYAEYGIAPSFNPYAFSFLHSAHQPRQPENQWEDILVVDKGWSRRGMMIENDSLLVGVALRGRRSIVVMKYV